MDKEIYYLFIVNTGELYSVETEEELDRHRNNLLTNNQLNWGIYIN